MGIYNTFRFKYLIVMKICIEIEEAFPSFWKPTLPQFLQDLVKWSSPPRNFPKQQWPIISLKFFSRSGEPFVLCHSAFLSDSKEEHGLWGQRLQFESWLCLTQVGQLGKEFILFKLPVLSSKTMRIKYVFLEVCYYNQIRYLCSVYPNIQDIQ